MGRSGGKKKKSGGSHGLCENSSSNANGVVLDSSVLLKRAHELKEEGNKRFQSKDYTGALDEYNKAIKLIPKGHRDLAVFHSNIAACLMQMKPINYEAVITECSVALQAQPLYVKALLRRARALEFIGKHDMAMQDVQLLLDTDPTNKDAQEISRRLRTFSVPPHDAQQDLPSRPSPAALGASVAGIGPCLPPRTGNKKTVPSTSRTFELSNGKLEKAQVVSANENGSVPQTIRKPALSPGISSKPSYELGKNDKNQQKASFAFTQISNEAKDVVRLRPLKLVYDHDVRLAEMPVNCSFKLLREIVAKRFPSSKYVLIKYKDGDGDLVTITSNKELRLAELSVGGQPENGESNHISMLRLYVVEVNPEQEPSFLEEEEQEEDRDLEVEVPVHVETTDREGEECHEDKVKDGVDNDVKELEIDDWLFDFAQLFRAHVGVDPEAHLDLQNIGMEFLSEAIEETVTCEEAQPLFDKAALKFQEIAALAFFNWGNVHMCSARKRVPLDESAGKEVVDANLDAAYDWVKAKYILASEKYNEALRVKPDFYEGLLALGQQEFEMAKLQWSYASTKKVELSNWDSTGTFDFLNSAEVKMKAATEMWMKVEEQRENELKNPSAREEILKRKKKKSENDERETSAINVVGLVLADEAAEQAAIMRSQMNLFWGNMLFERSQIECKLGLNNWRENLDTAIERFKLAGASNEDVSLVLKNHSSNLETLDGDQKKGEVFMKPSD